MTSPDLARANIDKLAELFPAVVSETFDAVGDLTKTIDFDLLRRNFLTNRRGTAEAIPSRLAG